MCVRSVCRIITGEIGIRCGNRESERHLTKRKVIGTIENIVPDYSFCSTGAVCVRVLVHTSASLQNAR